MPGKYSHSVVLADYSNRGIISLPPDQYTKYISSSPQPSSRPTSQARVRGTRSAQAAPYPSRSDNPAWRASTADRPHPSLKTGASSVQAQIEVPEEDEIAALQPTRYSQYYRQMPNSSPNVNLTSSHSFPKLPSKVDSRTAYQRQQQRNTSNNLSPEQTRRPQSSGLVRDTGNVTSEDEDPWIPTRGFRSARPAANRRKDYLESIETDAPSRSWHVQTERSSQTRQPAELARRQDRNNEPDFSSTWLASQSSPEPPPYEDERHKVEVQPQTSQVTKQKAQQKRNGRDASTLTSSGESGRPDQQLASREARKPQSRAPHSSNNVAVGLNVLFDDTVSPRAKSSPALTSAPQQQIRKNEQTQFSTPILSTRMNSSRDVSAATAKLNTITASTNYRPISSGSSTNTASNLASSLTGKGSSPSDSKTSNFTAFSPPQSHMDRQSWQLPDIKEDQDFTPSIFEGRFSYDGSRNVNREDIEQSIGQISSGKDVTFDDAASELSAALPPPISRFRDEEDEFNANMARLLGEGGDYAITKKGSHTFGRSSKKRGLFAKFRTKA